MIFLARSDHLELLKTFADEVWVPEPVAEEILHRGQHDITARAIEKTDWLIRKPVGPIPAAILDWRLGSGESTVLALAIEHRLEEIIDDLVGRCATCSGIPVRDTLGIVLAVKKRGIIQQARPVIEDMLKTRLYLSKKVLDKALERVGK